MIRKAVIVVLTLGALASLTAYPLSVHRTCGYRGGMFGMEWSHGSAFIAPAGDREERGWYCWKNERSDVAIEVYGSSGRPVTWFPVWFKTTYGWWVLEVPLWMLFLLLAAYPTIAFIRGPLRRWRRRRRGECVNCGYNLTGNVTGVCSECGRPVVVPR